MLPLRPLPNLQRFGYDAEQRLIQVIQTQLYGRLHIEDHYGPLGGPHRGRAPVQKDGFSVAGPAPVAGGSEWYAMPFRTATVLTEGLISTLLLQLACP